MLPKEQKGSGVEFARWLLKVPRGWGFMPHPEGVRHWSVLLNHALQHTIFLRTINSMVMKNTLCLHQKAKVIVYPIACVVLLWVGVVPTTLMHRPAVQPFNNVNWPRQSVCNSNLTFDNYMLAITISYMTSAKAEKTSVQYHSLAWPTISS